MLSLLLAADAVAKVGAAIGGGISVIGAGTVSYTHLTLPTTERV